MSGARSRIVSKSDFLGLHQPKKRKHQFVHVRVTVESGSICVESLEKRLPFQKKRVCAQHSLKTVWVNNMLDDECSQVKNCFAVITPEVNFILQAGTHRSKIEWMQSLSIAISQSLKFRGSYRPSSWNNLEDLERWLTVREVEFTFQAHEQYKGARFHGKWNAGMPHICGSMRWPNGDRYDGEFMFGKFHGTGTMRWLTDKHKRSYTGRWQNGRMEGHGEMTYADQSVYTGWWHMDQRHGHGTIEYKLTDSVYTGGWESDLRSGYGVLSNGIKSERYLGMWQKDRYHGAGILVAKNQFYYSGMFANGERDIASTASVRVVVQDDKWEPLFLSCTSLLEQMVSISHSNPDVNHSLEDDNGIDDAFFTEDGLMNFQDIGASPDLDASCENCHTVLKGAEECVVCRVEGFKSADHPFGILVNNLTRCFTESYSGMGAHRNMLPHAIGELYSITVRLHQLIRRICPSVITKDANNLLGKPSSLLTMMLKTRKGDTPRSSRISTSSQLTNSDPSWLYPILLPSTFPTLFALYVEHYSEDDHRLAKLMADLGQRDDEELCIALDLESAFEQWREKHDEGSFTACFDGAVQIFQKINEYLTPLNKLLCIQEANGEITQVWEAIENKGRNSPVSSTAEENQAVFTKIFSLVIVKSQVTNLCSEIQFIQDFAGTTLLTEEYGFLMTVLKDCYYQILDIQRTSS